MALAHFKMLFNGVLNKNPDIVQEELHLIILDSRSDVCMVKNGNTKHTRHIERRMHFVRNGEKFQMHKIYWCEGVIQLADIANKNVGKHYLIPRMKYIMVRFDN